MIGVQGDAPGGEHSLLADEPYTRPAVVGNYVAQQLGVGLVDESPHVLLSSAQGAHCALAVKAVRRDCLVDEVLCEVDSVRLDHGRRYAGGTARSGPGPWSSAWLCEGRGSPLR